MVTFTLPQQLRPLAWRHQRRMYSILMSSAASTLKDFGLNPKHLGAELGMTTILHTHSRRIDFHRTRSLKTPACPGDAGVELQLPSLGQIDRQYQASTGCQGLPGVHVRSASG